MAKHCEICGKKPGFGHSVSHAQNRTNRRWNPNLQSIRTRVNGSTKRLTICTSCLKAGKVARHSKKAEKPA